jgi:inner membrane protein
MTWKSHIAIATAITIPFNPQQLPFAILGSTAPDWIEYILKFFGIHVEHRGVTHYLYIPLIFILLGIFHDIFYWFGIGYFTHWFADSLTKSGVPISQFDTHRIHFFGGKITTGEPLEYIIAFGLLAISVTFVKPNMDLLKDLTIKKEETKEIIKYNPYYNDYRELYKKEIIDPKTMKENRFKLF